MSDRISRFRVARLSLYPPQVGTGAAPYALIANTIRNGVPRAQIVVDGRLPGVNAAPTTEELLEAFDAVLRRHMLG